MSCTVVLLCDVLLFLGYTCTWSHYGYHIFGVAEHANVGLRTKTVCLSCLCFSCFLTVSIHFQAISYIMWFLCICGVEEGKGDWWRALLDLAKRTEGVSSFRFCFFLTRKKCSTSYWESPGLVLGLCGGKAGAGSTRMFLQQSLVLAGSHGCAQSARAHSALQSHAPVACRMLPSVEVYCLGTNTCFFCYIKWECGINGWLIYNIHLPKASGNWTWQKWQRSQRKFI